MVGASQRCWRSARAGVDVFVHVDGVGAIFNGTATVVRHLRQAGVRVRWFNRWHWNRPLAYNLRNHRKLLVVDEQLAYIGGFNLHREASRAASGATRWRDAHVRLEGMIGRQAARLFDASWLRQAWPEPPAWQGDYRLVPNSTRACRRAMRCLYRDAVDLAHSHIHMATPYFVPDRAFRRGLVNAARRGVDVRILLPACSDHRLAHWLGRMMARPLARAGVHVLAYLPRMLHSKLMLVDGDWAMVGSANIDYRSFYINSELNLVTRDAELCRQLERIFMEDCAEAADVAFDDAGRGLLRTVLGAIGWRMRRWF